jgi:hypothetical protein
VIQHPKVHRYFSCNFFYEILLLSRRNVDVRGVAVRETTANRETSKASAPASTDVDINTPEEVVL